MSDVPPRRFPPLLKDLIVPSPHDILCGRGGHNAHAGNVTFRRLVTAKKDHYVSLGKHSHNKAAKEVIVLDILQAVEDAGGRFLFRDGGPEEPWQVLTDHKKIRTKVMQGLRDYKFEGDEARDHRLYYETENLEEALWTETQRLGRERHLENLQRIRQYREDLRASVVAALAAQQEVPREDVVPPVFVPPVAAAPTAPTASDVPPAATVFPPATVVVGAASTVPFAPSPPPTVEEDDDRDLPTPPPLSPAAVGSLGGGASPLSSLSSAWDEDTAMMFHHLQFQDTTSQWAVMQGQAMERGAAAPTLPDDRLPSPPRFQMDDDSFNVLLQSVLDS